MQTQSNQIDWKAEHEKMKEKFAELHKKYATSPYKILPNGQVVKKKPA